MTERPERGPEDEDFEPEREESTDLGYRDTKEERAYEKAEDDSGGETADAEDA